MFDPMRMHGIIRYVNRARIKDEDLAQHSYSVAYYCFQIAMEFCIPDDIRNEAIAMAIIHDIGECFTSDLPHDVKYENPELKELCDKLEKKYVDQLREISPLWNKLEDKENPTISGTMVKLADSMSVEAYAEREISLGNKTPIMQEILSNAKERIEKQEKLLIERMEEYDGN